MKGSYNVAFWSRKIYFLRDLNSYSVVTILSHLFHNFGYTLYFENIKVLLKCTLKNGIPGEKNFPDRFCPVSGFLLKYLVSCIFIKISFRYTQFMDFLWSHMFPDVRIRFFGQKSGFLKTSFLKSVWLKKLFVKKIFPDKIRPGSGFALECPVFHIYLNITHRYIQIYELSCSPISLILPDIRIRILIFFFNSSPFH